LTNAYSTFKSIPLKFSAFSAQESYEKFGGWLARLSSETTRAFGGKEVSILAVPKIAPLNFSSSLDLLRASIMLHVHHKLSPAPRTAVLPIFICFGCGGFWATLMQSWQISVYPPVQQP
jgi:hypothetical protein